jgi:transposase
MTTPIERVNMSKEELEALLERARTAPLSDRDYARLKGVVETLGYLTDLLEDRKTTIQKLRQLLFGATTEKTRNLVKPELPQAGAETGPQQSQEGPTPPADLDDKQTPKPAEKPKGHGRNGASSYTGATEVKIRHESLKAGDCCPKCQKGKVYPSVAPHVIVRIVGQAPLGATVYKMESLRCNLCLEIFTAQAPEGIGENKYDEKSGSILGLLRYGSGFPFYRLEHLQGSMGIPVPDATQWEIVSEVAEVVVPAFEEFIRQAAQGEVLHNDDTPMKVLALMKGASGEGDSAEGPERTGIYTSGIVSIAEGRKIVLFFTGHKHAGENLSDVLAKREAELGPPIQMCDALSRNLPKEFEVLLGNCTAHGRRKFVDVFSNFPGECRYVLETLGDVYKNDATAKEQGMSDEERLAFHQAQSGPLMEVLEKWLKEQIAERKTEPNSGLGKAISYWNNHWKALTLFLRVPGAPLDNNVVERGLKKAILHRKNSMFFKTAHGARVGDIFMSLIHTCELAGENPFDYLTELQKHAAELSQSPKDWMPWNYRQTIANIRGSP